MWRTVGVAEVYDGAALAAKKQHQVFCACLPGLESALAAELASLGVTSPKAIEGGVELLADPMTIHRVTLRSGVVASLRIRVTKFDARHFKQLELGLSKVKWGRVIAAGSPWRVEVTCARSRLYHTKAIAERVERVVADALGRPPLETGLAKGASHAGHDGLVIHLRLRRDRCVVSVEPSGLGLHRRGWRLDAGSAPLREDLAFAMLSLGGWEPHTSLLDPFCGSGTLVIEAARRRAGIPPGGQRIAELERWTVASAANVTAWTRAETERASASASASAESDDEIVGRDIDEAQLEAARANATRAGVAALLHFERADAGSLLDVPMRPVGHLITNPPWGRRVGGGAGAAPIPRLLQQLAEHTPKQWGWTVILPAQGRPRFGRLGTGPVATVRSGGVRARVEVRTAGGGPVIAPGTSPDATAS